MHAIKITPNLLFEYQCTSGKFIRLPNRIESYRNFLPELECSTGRRDGPAATDRKLRRVRACAMPTNCLHATTTRGDFVGSRGEIPKQPTTHIKARTPLLRLVVVLLRTCGLCRRLRVVVELLYDIT